LICGASSSTRNTCLSIAEALPGCPKHSVSSVSGRQREATGSAQRKGGGGGAYDVRYEAAAADMSAR